MFETEIYAFNIDFSILFMKRLSKEKDWETIHNGAYSFGVITKDVNLRTNIFRSKEQCYFWKNKVAAIFCGKL